MALWRPFRRQNRDLGTLGGNPSELDEVNAEGPPVLGTGFTGIAAGVGLWDEERSAAASADLARDVDSDFDAANQDENDAWDPPGGGSSDDHDEGSSENSPTSE
jgi:hypothetical protein